MDYTVVRSDELSKKKNDDRYVVTDLDGNVLDDCQGYGFKSEDSAYKSYVYEISGNQVLNSSNQKKKAINDWCDNNSEFCEKINQIFKIIDIKTLSEIDAEKLMNILFEMNGYTDLPFKTKNFLLVYDRYLSF